GISEYPAGCQSKREQHANHDEFPNLRHRGLLWRNHPNAITRPDQNHTAESLGRLENASFSSTWNAIDDHTNGKTGQSGGTRAAEKSDTAPNGCPGLLQQRAATACRRPI